MKLRLFNIIFLAFLATGCKEYRCTASQEVLHPAIPDQWVYWPSESVGLGITPYGAGISMGGGMHFIPGRAAFVSTECVTWEEVPK